MYLPHAICICLMHVHTLPFSITYPLLSSQVNQSAGGVDVEKQKGT